jgi:hypothetical protein
MWITKRLGLFNSFGRQKFSFASLYVAAFISK